MIIGLVGGVGSGKTTSAVKKIVDSPYHCFVNFKINSTGVTRILKEHIMREEVIGQTPKGKDKLGLKINWDFWNDAVDQHGQYHIFMDEIQNIAHSRASGTKWNILFTNWMAQIRKVLGQSERTHIYLITQKLQRMDVAFRDLMHKIIAVRKFETDVLIPTPVMEQGGIVVKMLPLTYFFQYHFEGEFCEQDYYDWMILGKKKYSHRTRFIGNFYFQFYESYKIVGESAYL